MATPIIQSVGTTSGAGTPGEGRNDLIISETVNLSDTEVANSGATYLWTFEDIPIGSSATLVNPTTATPSFVPDIVGSYRINCEVNSTDSSIEVLAVPLVNTGSRIPSFEEETSYDAGGNAKGWHEAMDDFMREVDSQLGTASTDEKVSVSSNDTTPDYLLNKLAAGTNVSINELSDGGDEDVEIAVASAAPSGSASGDLSGTYPGPAVAAITTTTGPQKLTIGAITDGQVLQRSGTDLIGATSVGTDEKVSVTSNDTTPDYLLNKLAEGAAISITETGDGGDEDATIAVSDLTDSEVAAANVDGVAGTASMRTLGTGAQTACAGNDSRLSDARTPTSHNLGGTEHAADTLANLNAKVSDATLDDDDDPRPADEIITTTGPTTMAVGAVADGEYLKRSGSTVVGDTPAGGSGTADALSTTGADVDVSAAAPPTTGQVLKATAATTATWQDESGGSSQVLAAAGGDYLHAHLGTAMTSTLSLPQRVLIDTVNEQRGDLALDVTTNVGRVSGLKAGRTYQLIGQLRGNGSAGWWNVEWYDVTAAVLLAGRAGPVAVNSTGAISSTPIASYVFTPTEDTEVEFRITGASSTDHDIDPNNTYIQVFEIGAVQANVIGGLEYLDTIEVTSDVTSVLFGEGGDGVLNRALDGEVDGGYVLSYHNPDPGATIELQLRPNSIDPAVSGNFYGARHYGGSSNGVGNTSSTWRINGQADGFPEAGHLEIPFAKTGIERNFVATTSLHNGVAAYVNKYSGVWQDTTTAITSLQVFSTTASAIKDGARFVLWRKTPNNLRADNASTYERNVEATVAQGTNSEVEYTTGHATYQGSAVGLSVSLNDTVTAGTVTVNLKVGGVTKLTAILNTTDTYFARAIESVGVHTMAPGDEIEIGIATSGLTTTGGGTPGITVNATLVNSALVQSPTQIGYAELFLSAPQTTNLLVDNHLEFDTISSRGNLFSLATGAGQADGLLTIQPGTYDLEMLVRFEGNGNDSVTLILRDDSDDSTVLSDAGRQLRILTASSNLATGWSPVNTTRGIVTFANEITVKLDITGISGTLTSLRGDSWIIIKELR